MANQHFNESGAVLVFPKVFDQRLLHLGHQLSDAIPISFEFAGVYGTGGRVRHIGASLLGKGETAV